MSLFIQKSERERLKEMGLIIENVHENDQKMSINDYNQIQQYDDNQLTDLQQQANQIENEDADYDIQNELIKFFVNNDNVTPEIFDQYAISLGIDPQDFRYQQNILMSQLIKIYVNDADDMGYGDSLENDEISDDIIQMISKNDGVDI